MKSFEPRYLLMIGLGLGLGIVLYVINCIILLKDSNKNKVKATACFGFCAIAAVMSAFGLNYLLHPIAYNQPFKEISGLIFHTFYSITFFGMYSIFVLKMVKLDAKKYLDAIVPAILICVAVSKIGCIFAGCCGGNVIEGIRIPTAEIEAVTGIFLFLLFQFLIKSNRFVKYVLIYAPFRFVVEFFRARTHSVMIFGVLKPEQLIAIILITVASLYYYNVKWRINHGKGQKEA